MQGQLIRANCSKNVLTLFSQDILLLGDVIAVCRLGMVRVLKMTFLLEHFELILISYVV